MAAKPPPKPPGMDARLRVTELVASVKNLTSIEAEVRACTGCEGATCAFLRTQPYRRLRFAALRRLNGKVTHEADMRADGPGITLCLDLDAGRLCLWLRTPDGPRAEEKGPERDPKRRTTRFDDFARRLQVVRRATAGERPEDAALLPGTA